uniref:SEP domain-containing protein n=1 Tax=Spongospora subterranea TaxID=70186 RepID=A0A0H5R7Z2_9EUKA|eukprot:CRZ09842.1 hypothetical protein [Spongospora subterranea]
MSRKVGTLADLSKKPAADDRKMEEFQQGGSQSGTAVFRPVRDLPDAIIDAGARQAQNGMGPVAEAVLRITVYRNGFLISDPAGTTPDRFRDIQDPGNQEFMRSLVAGEVPTELEQQLQGRKSKQDIGVQLIDKRGETYDPPFEAFSGAGNALRANSTPDAVHGDFANAAPTEIVVDPTAPTSAVLVVTAAGSRLRIQVNPEFHTVLDIYQHVLASTGSTAPFTMLSGVPPRPLVQPSATIRAAGLEGASIRCKPAC